MADIKAIIKQGIYKIVSPSGRIYIGQTIDIARRFKEYKNLRCKSQPKLYNSLKKYGPDKHIFEILEECPTNFLLEREVFYKKLFNSVEKGLNCELYDIGSGGPRSKETIAKISKSQKGIPKKGGWHHSDESKKLKSELAKGKPKPKGFGKKITQAKANNPNLGDSYKKRIIDLNTGKIYNSCTEAAQDNNISPSIISNSLNGLYKKSKWNFKHYG